MTLLGAGIKRMGGCACPTTELKIPSWPLPHQQLLTSTRPLPCHQPAGPSPYAHTPGTQARRP